MIEHAERAWRHIDGAAQAHGIESASVMTFRPAEPPHDAADTALIMQQLMARPAAGDDHGFELLEKLGEGGMGVVMRARQRVLGREVAVKRLVVEDEPHRLAFMSEAHIMGRLEHANIVPVHTLTAGGQAPMLAMKLIEGGTWSALIRRGDVPLDEHLRIFEAVCNAVAFAHSRGILHRDLKPDNVAIGDFGQVFVMDWGVSAALDEEACRDTAIFAVREVPGPVGTPCYMAPELAAGDASQQDERTDVYLLGACLYEVLTGRRRHAGDSIQRLREVALASEPPCYGPEVPAELAELCTRAMAREPAGRFGSVRALMLALEAYREHTAARALIADGEALSRRLAAMLADGRPARSEMLSREVQREDEAQREAAIQALYSRASYAFERALELWPEAPARGALAELHQRMLSRALAVEDVGQARRLATLLGSDEARAQVEALAARAEQRQRELLRLRSEQQRSNWDLVARPLSSCYLLAALLGTAALAASLWGLSLPKEQTVMVVGSSWLAVLLGSGGYAFMRLRQIALPGYLISPRVFGSWAAVGLAITINGVLGAWRGIVPFSDAEISALLFGVGFAATALQTRSWLLVPALIWFVAAFLIGLTPYEANMPVFGIVWALTLGGVGIALRRGAPLEPTSGDNGEGTIAVSSMIIK